MSRFVPFALEAHAKLACCRMCVWQKVRGNHERRNEKKNVYIWEEYLYISDNRRTAADLIQMGIDELFAGPKNVINSENKITQNTHTYTYGTQKRAGRRDGRVFLFYFFFFQIFFSGKPSNRSRPTVTGFETTEKDTRFAHTPLVWRYNLSLGKLVVRPNNYNKICTHRHTDSIL